ncbi:MAG: ATP-binding protein [Atopobiaceae bacterium]|nr:ATP-binding protein [Atopobiaceae bacterium]
MLEVQRPHYLKKLSARQDNGRVKVITGIRRCGKSYLLNRLYKQHLIDLGIGEDQIIEVALDEARNARLRNPFELDTFVRERVSDDSMRYYLFLDEIQFSSAEVNPYTSDPNDIITFVDVILGLQRLENVDIYVTGSNSKMLSSDILTQFEDRADNIHLHPLSFAEYSSAIGDSNEDLRDYLVFGGMPRIINETSIQDKSRYLKQLFEETYLRDVIQRNNLRVEQEELGIVLDFIASSIGSLTNPARLENRFLSERHMRVNHTTISSYLKCFEDAFIISSACRFDIKGGGYFKTPLKYYFEDVGLRNARLNFRQDDENHLIENVVYSELLRRGFNVDVGVVSHRTQGVSKQFEVDFVANLISKRYYIQVALGIDDPGKREQEIASLKRIGDSFKKIVIVKDDIIPWHDERGILYLGLRRFLVDESSMDF